MDESKWKPLDPEQLIGMEFDGVFVISPNQIKNEDEILCRVLDNPKVLIVIDSLPPKLFSIDKLAENMLVDYKTEIPSDGGKVKRGKVNKPYFRRNERW